MWRIFFALVVLCQLAGPSLAGPPPLPPTPPFLPPNSIPGVTNFDPALLPHARVAFARVRQNKGRAKVLFIGDSTTVGFGAGTVAGWTGAKQLAFPAVATKIINGAGLPADNSAVVASGSVANFTYDATLTLGTGWVQGPFTTGGWMWQQTTDTGTALAHTPGISVDQCDVYYVDTGSATLSIDIDGGAATSITPGATLNILKQTMTMVAGAHTINIKRTSGSGTVYITLIDCYLTTTNRVSMYNAGASSATTNTWTGGSVKYGPVASIAVYAPDLCFINLGINDETNGFSYATYYANMQTLIDACKLSGDVILIMHHATTHTAAQENVTLSALTALSIANNAPLVNLKYRLGSYTQANTLLEMYDGLHATALGYGDEGAMIADLIGRL